MIIILALFTLLVSTPAAAQQPVDGYELIEMMYNANKSNWYETLCFSQEVYYYENDSIIKSDIWLEAYKSPGNLILKFSDWDSGNGLLFTKDSLYTYREGVLQSVQYRIHDLVVLGLDINNIPPEITAERALKCGYDLSLIAEDQVSGHQAWVVGDTSGTCFWVDMETLLFLKMRRRTGENPREAEFALYEYIDGYPVATEIRFYNVSGKLNMVEKYFSITPNCRVKSATFQPVGFSRALW